MLPERTNPEPKASEPQKSYLIDAASGKFLKLLHPDDLFFIKRDAGNIDVVPKSRVSGLFRRDGVNIKYYDRGADIAPGNSAQYVTIEEVEELTEHLSDSTAREDAQTALTEDERRPESQEPRLKHITDNDPAVR